MELKRIQWIDLCKGFAIILVLLGHTYSRNNYLIIWINSFHMSLFFVLSGFLIGIRKIYNRPLKRVIANNVKGLLVPYFAYSILLTVFLRILKNGGRVEFITGLLDDLKYVFILYGNSPMWFLSCLFLSEIVLMLLYRLQEKLRLILSGITIIAGVWLPQEVIIMSLLCRCLRAVFYLTLGGILSNINLKKWKSMCLPFVIGHLFLCILNEMPVREGVLFGNNRALSIICSIVGAVGWILVFSCYVKKNLRLNWLDFYGKNTLTVLCTHSFIIEAVRLLDYKLFNNRVSSLGIFEGVFITIICLTLEVPIIKVISRYVPILAGKQKTHTVAVKN